MLRSLLLTSCLLIAACGSDAPSAPSPTPAPPAFSQTDLVVGTGAEATAGRRLSVNYTLWLYDPTQAELKGRLVESSVGAAPFSFTLGAGQVIAGWDQGFAGMRVGGRRRLVIPPSLAYGSSGSGSIPPNTSLVFDVELLAVQ
jgi:FKBP-type peptidyl-prolyl cis-trans isomerase FkpA